MKRAVAVRHVLFEDLGLIEPLLLARGYDITYMDPAAPRWQALADVELAVILGGPIGVYDTDAYPFLTNEASAISTRLGEAAPTLGVCLGAQLIAKALGAGVTATGTKEIGYSRLNLTAAGRTSALAPLDQQPVLHWHGDQFEVPARATRLAETPGFPNQAFTLGDATLALQFHIEADHTRIERWLIGHAHELATAGIDPRTIRADAANHGPALATRAHRVINDWLDAAGG